MNRGFLLALVLVSSAGSMAGASEPAAVEAVSGQQEVARAAPTLIPGRDAQLERERREQPFGPWGWAPWLVLSAAAAWATRRALAQGRPDRGRQLLALTSVLIGGMVAELALRVTVDDWALHVKVRDGCYHDNPRGYFTEATYLDDPKTTAWCAGPLTDVWATCEAPTAIDRAEVHRVMALGDSFTDGVGVFARDTWPAQLDGLLGQSAAVVNCGKAASFTAQTAKRFLAHRDRHAPATVIYAFVLNDVVLQSAAPLDGTDIAFQLPDRQTYLDAVWGPIARESALGRLVIERLVTDQVHRETLRFYEATYGPDNEAAVDEAMDLIGAMNELVSRDGAHLLVAIWPLLEELDAYPFGFIHARVTAELEERGIAVLDMLPTFSGRDEADLHVHPTDHHPNEVAHGLAAEAIARDLAVRGWIR